MSRNVHCTSSCAIELSDKGLAQTLKFGSDELTLLILSPPRNPTLKGFRVIGIGSGEVSLGEGEEYTDHCQQPAVAGLDKIRGAFGGSLL